MTTEDIIREAAQDVAETQDIHARAMLVCVSTSFWGAHVTDKKVTDEVNREHAASKEAGKYRKQLFANNAPKHKAAVRAATGARAVLGKHALRWSDEGWWLLPSASYMLFAEDMRAQQAALDAALDDFLAEYDALVEQARVDLNGLWRAEDYPTPSQVRRKFGIRVDYRPLPAAGDFRLDLPADARESIAKNVTDRVQEALRDAMADAWDRLYRVVEHMGKRIAARSQAEDDGRAPAFHASVIGNMMETAEALGRLNIAGDPALEAIRQRVLTELGQFDVDDIKYNDTAREMAAKKVDDILATMSQFYQPPTEG